MLATDVLDHDEIAFRDPARWVLLPHSIEHPDGEVTPGLVLPGHLGLRNVVDGVDDDAGSGSVHLLPKGEIVLRLGSVGTVAAPVAPDLDEINRELMRWPDAMVAPRGG